MIRGGRQRHLVMWLGLTPLLGLDIVLGLQHTPPPAISDGPVPIAEATTNSDSPEPTTPPDGDAP